MERASEDTVQITVHSQTRKIVSRDLKSILFQNFQVLESVQNFSPFTVLLGIDLVYKV